MKTLILTAIRYSLIFLLATLAQADSAEWLLDPDSGDWNSAPNWTPGGPPNGPDDTATFGLSHTTDVFISANTQVNSITFTSVATNRYTITVNPGLMLTLSGTAGIVNNALDFQTFVTGTSGGTTGGKIVFTNRATAGVLTYFENNGGGSTIFNDTSTAGGGRFINSGATATGAGAGSTMFNDTSEARIGTFSNNGATVSGGLGGSTTFGDSSTAANGTFENNGGTVSGAGGGSTIFKDSSHADSATLIANGGTNGGGGGTIRFLDDSDGGRMAVRVFGNGSLFVTARIGDFTIGSIEGSGNVSAVDREIVVGGNNRNTEFSGVIETGAAFSKEGTGRLTLSEGGVINTGNAFINEGVLQVNGSLNPLGGSTSVSRRATLEGTGRIQAQQLQVTNGGTVSPGKPSAPGRLTVGGDYIDADSFATLMIQIAGKSDGQFSVLSVFGHVGVDGILEPVLLNGFIPALGDSFVFLGYESHDGKFSHIRDPLPGDGLFFKVDYGANQATLNVVEFVPDRGSTFLLLTLGLLGLVICQRSLRHKRA